MMGIVAVVAVVAVGGIGFSAFTSSAYVNGSGSAGTLGPLYFTHVKDVDGPGESCLSTITTTYNQSDTLNVYASNLAPGAYCNYYEVLHNAGSLGAEVYATLTCDSSYCPGFWYADNFATEGYSTYSAYGPLYIGPGGAISYTGELGLEPTDGNAYQGVTCWFTITITATPGTS